jgi:protein-S-isoprenylcysteine O-methyltransferase Ste14
VLAACGGLLALDGALRMGSRLTPSPRPRDGAPLLVNGSYALVRHPMYCGLILAAFGWALFMNGPLTLLYACILFGWLDMKSRHEERLLEETYDGYADYRSRVRRLVPFVY